MRGIATSLTMKTWRKARNSLASVNARQDETFPSIPLKSIQSLFSVRCSYIQGHRKNRQRHKGNTAMDTVEITTRSDFTQWAIERAQEIVRLEGSALALAARDMDEAGLKESGAALGKAIADAMLEVFDGLVPD
jgi:hypothetical protein